MPLAFLTTCTHIHIHKDLQHVPRVLKIAQRLSDILECVLQFLASIPKWGLYFLIHAFLLFFHFDDCFLPNRICVNYESLHGEYM